MISALATLLLVHAMTPEDVRLRVVVGPEADSNARREIAGQVPHPDVLLRSQVSVAAVQDEGPHRLSVEGQWGTKVFRQQSTEDLWVGEARLRVDSRWHPRVATFVDVGGRDRRQASGLRTYETLTLDTGAVFQLLGPLTAVLSAGPRGFVSWPVRSAVACGTGTGWCGQPLATWEDGELRAPDDSLLRFSNAGFGTSASLAWRITGAEIATGTLGVDGRVFPMAYRAATVEDGVRKFDRRGRPADARGVVDQLRVPPRRADATGFGELALESARLLYLRANVRLLGNVSTSRGEQFFRARLGLTAGTLLPGQVRVLGEVQVQATRWPDGLGLGERLALQEGDESQTSASVQLSVPLPAGIWLEGRSAAYTAEFSSARTPFLRLVAFAGLGYRW